LTSDTTSNNFCTQKGDSSADVCSLPKLHTSCVELENRYLNHLFGARTPKLFDEKERLGQKLSKRTLELFYPEINILDLFKRAREPDIVNVFLVKKISYHSCFF